MSIDSMNPSLRMAETTRTAETVRALVRLLDEARRERDEVKKQLLQLMGAQL